MVVGDRVGNSPFFDSNTVFSTMDLWHDQFVASHAPPWLPVSLGHDYRTPTLFDAPLNSLPGRDKAAFMGEWANVSGPAVFGERTPAVEYNHVHGYLSSLQAAEGFAPPTLSGERPNLWYPETTWTHHCERRGSCSDLES